MCIVIRHWIFCSGFYIGDSVPDLQLQLFSSMLSMNIPNLINNSYSYYIGSNKNITHIMNSDSTPLASHVHLLINRKIENKLFKTIIDCGCSYQDKYSIRRMEAYKLPWLLTHIPLYIFYLSSSLYKKNINPLIYF